MTILLVDDNDDDVVLIREAFEQQSHFEITSIVHDGEEALAFLNQQGKYASEPLPGLMLLDINMPRMNGFEVLQAVKANPRLHHLPIIMMTTSDREEDVLRSFSTGACSYIHKPPSIQEMVMVVQQFAEYWGHVSKVPDTHGG
jgi:CheY-like chemotaxis protein